MQMKCFCPSCSVGLTCYRASRPVTGFDNRETDHLLWGDALQLVRDTPMLLNVLQQKPFSFAGTVFMSTKNLHE